VNIHRFETTMNCHRIEFFPFHREPVTILNCLISTEICTSWDPRARQHEFAESCCSTFVYSTIWLVY
jgi:hypothetical protein